MVKQSLKHNCRALGLLLCALLLIQTLVTSTLASTGKHHPAMRIVSLAPSNTELLYDIGAQDQIVGVSSYCDYPPEAKSKEKAGSFVSVNMERLAGLKPEVVVLVNGQESLQMSLEHHSYKTVLLRNDHLSDIPKNLITLGRLTGHEEKANQLASSLTDSLNSFHRIVSQGKSHPNVFYCVWPEPLLTVGSDSFLNDVITACGGINIASNIKKDYPQISLESLVLANPDDIILPHEANPDTFLKKAPWPQLRAVKENKVYVLPAQEKDRVSRPTLRIREGLFWLASRLHPELTSELTDWLGQNTSKP